MAFARSHDHWGEGELICANTKYRNETNVENARSLMCQY
jgi:hypothetical protein